MLEKILMPAQLRVKQFWPVEAIAAFRAARISQPAQVVFAKWAKDRLLELCPIRRIDCHKWQSRSTSINGQPQRYLAEVNSTTGELLPTDLDVNESVLSLAVDGSKLFLGGKFTSVMTQERRRLAAFNLSSNLLMDWRADCDTLVDFGVTLLTLAEGRLYVSGDFTTIGSSNRSRLAAVEPNTGQVLAWDPNLSGTLPISAVVVRSNQVYLAGSFANVGGISHPLLAAVDRETGLLADWSPPVLIGQIFAMALVGNTVYVGGNFNFGPSYLAAIDATTGQFEAWDPSPSAPVTLITVGANSLYVGGEFDAIGGVGESGFNGTGAFHVTIRGVGIVGTIVANGGNGGGGGTGGDGGVAIAGSGQAGGSSNSMERPTISHAG